jgi:hypothetical protein
MHDFQWWAIFLFVVCSEAYIFYFLLLVIGITKNYQISLKFSFLEKLPNYKIFVLFESKQMISIVHGWRTIELKNIQHKTIEK